VAGLILTGTALASATMADAASPEAGPVSEDGTTALLQVRFDERNEDLSTATVEEVVDHARAANGDGLQVELGERNWWMPRWLDRVLPHLDMPAPLPRRRRRDPTPTPNRS
jgi:hypothetical protein